MVVRAHIQCNVSPCFSGLGLENFTAVEEQDIEYVNTPVQLGGVNAQTAWVGIQQTLSIVNSVRARLSALFSLISTCQEGLKIKSNALR